MVKEGQTGDERLAAVLKAQKINAVLGGAVVTPWQCAEIPEEWMDVMVGFADELPGLRATVKNQEQAHSAWLQKQGYRSYLKKRQ